MRTPQQSDDLLTSHEYRIGVVEIHTRNCANSKMVYERAISDLTQVQREAAEDNRVTLESAKRILDETARNLFKQYSGPMAEIGNIRDEQIVAKRRQEALVEAKTRRDAIVIRVAKTLAWCLGILNTLLALYLSFRRH